MNEKNTLSQAAAKVTIGAVIGYVVYSGVINVAQLVLEPWYRSSLFSVGGSLLAVIALLAGALAFMRGASTLDSRHRQFAAIGMVAGVSYLGYITLKLTTA